jgi:hypothetical protein
MSMPPFGGLFLVQYETGPPSSLIGWVWKVTYNCPLRPNRLINSSGRSSRRTTLGLQIYKTPGLRQSHEDPKLSIGLHAMALTGAKFYFLSLE